MAALYSVGPDQIDDRDCEGYEWVVYWYEIGDYCGDGEAVSFDGTYYRVHGLSHCSCYGPEDGMQCGDIVSLDSLLGSSITPGTEIRSAILDKVRELV